MHLFIHHHCISESFESQLQTGEGNGYPLQCSCLENSMDRGAWWTIVHAVAESDTTGRLTLFATQRCPHPNETEQSSDQFPQTRPLSSTTPSQPSSWKWMFMFSNADLENLLFFSEWARNAKCLKWSPTVQNYLTLGANNPPLKKH